MTRRRKLVILAAAAAIAAGVLGWHSTRKPLSDREQLEQLLDQMQRAAHTKNVKLGLSYVSGDYHDSFGLNKWAIQRLALWAREKSQSFRVLISDLSLSINRNQAQGRMELEVVVRSEDVIEAQFSGPIVLSFRKERGGWKIISASGWQSWMEGFD